MGLPYWLRKLLAYIQRTVWLVPLLVVSSAAIWAIIPTAGRLPELLPIPRLALGLVVAITWRSAYRSGWQAAIRHSNTYPTISEENWWR